MSPEATDALLEFVRERLGRTMLRGLHAPRRLRLRIPAVKDWLRHQGYPELAEYIADWDSVRTLKGAWKQWETTHLKRIMLKSAKLRSAKRFVLRPDVRDYGSECSTQALETFDAVSEEVGNITIDDIDGIVVDDIRADLTTDMALDPQSFPPVERAVLLLADVDSSLRALTPVDARQEAALSEAVTAIVALSETLQAPALSATRSTGTMQTTV